MQDKVQLYFSSILYELHRCYPSVAKSLVLPMTDDTKLNVEKASNLALGNSSAKLSCKPQLFRSVMEQLSLKEREIKPYAYSIPCKPLDLATFPQKEVHTNDNVIGQITQFLTEVESRELLKSSNEYSLNTFLTLLEIYTTNIAVGSTLEGQEWLPDVSLFHHLKMVSVFTVCLSTENKEDFLLIGGDISGIQSFIYDIVSKNASKNLKGRSFYLQLLVDTVLNRLLKSLQLNKAHIIYASGGGFFVLAPNTRFIIDELAKVEKELSDKIYDAHKTSLYLAFDSEILTQNQIFNSNASISQSWKQLLEKLNTKKRKRYSDKLIQSFDSFFEPQEVGGNRERDAITNEEFSDEETAEIERLLRSNDFKGKLVQFLDRNVEDEIGKPVKVSTYEQIKLGESLSDAQYWIVSDNELNINVPQYETCKMGVFNYFLDKNEFERYGNQLSEVNINLFNQTQIPKGFRNNCGLNFTFYGGNEVPKLQKPINGRSNKTFDELAGKSDFSRLGILRMDVDNLGQIFQKGFLPNEMTLSRYSTLSSRLDWFFKGYLNILREKEKEDVLILYSGGDDLFILGKWDKVLNMAKDIRDKFQEWSCYNSEISISGGMALVPNKFPIKQGAKAAKDAEDSAKHYKYFLNCPKGKSKKELEEMLKVKNAFCFLDMPLSWENEFTLVQGLKTSLRSYLQNDEGRGALSEGLLNKIQIYRDMQKVQTAKNENPKWMWLTAYEFSQMKRRIRNNDPQADNAKAFLDELKVSVISNSFRGNKMLIEVNHSDWHQRTFLQQLEFAARWTSFERRTEKK